MARNQRKYNTEYKVQAVKLSNEIGSSKAAVELGIPVDTLYGWVRAVKEGRLDIGGGAHTPQTAMSLAEELNTLRKQVKQQEKEIRRLKEENEFLECVSSGTIRKFEWIFRQFKEEIRRLSSAKSSLVTQKWRSDARNGGLRNF